MQAVLASGGVEIGDPEALRDGEAPVPELRPRDVLVRVQAVSVNPVDTKVRSRMDAGEERILGYDAVGRVDAVGEQAEGLSVGDRVWYAGDVSRPGSNAELQAVDERVVSRAPESLSDAEAAALPLCAVTAWESLFERLRLGPESEGTLLVIAAAGGVGSILIQLARVLTPGVRVIATASRPASSRWVTELGAHTVIDHHELLEQGRTAAPEGVNWIFSPHSAGNESAFAELLRPFGEIVAIDDPDQIALEAFKPKAIAWHWEYMFARPMHGTADMAEQGEILRRVAQLVDRGAGRATATETIPGFSAASLRRAHELVLDGHMVGKVVVTR
jgi:zinc-binding alcohol dehydrogenase family protein